MFTTFILQHLFYNMFTTFTKVFRSVLHKNAPLKTTKIRQNQALFMTKALRKAVMTRSTFRSNTINDHLDQTCQRLEQSKNYCKDLNKKTNKANF